MRTTDLLSRRDRTIAEELAAEIDAYSADDDPIDPIPGPVSIYPVVSRTETGFWGVIDNREAERLLLMLEAAGIDACVCRVVAGGYCLQTEGIFRERYSRFLRDRDDVAQAIEDVRCPVCQGTDRQACTCIGGRNAEGLPCRSCGGTERLDHCRECGGIGT